MKKTFFTLTSVALLSHQSFGSTGITDSTASLSEQLLNSDMATIENPTAPSSNQAALNAIIWASGAATVVGVFATDNQLIVRDPRTTTYIKEQNHFQRH